MKELFETEIHMGHSRYLQVSNIRCTLVGNYMIDHSDVVGASPVGAYIRVYGNQK